MLFSLFVNLIMFEIPDELLMFIAFVNDFESLSRFLNITSLFCELRSLIQDAWIQLSDTNNRAYIDTNVVLLSIKVEPSIVRDSESNTIPIKYTEIIIMEKTITFFSKSRM